VANEQKTDDWSFEVKLDVVLQELPEEKEDEQT
jgi:hypothetical protein